MIKIQNDLFIVGSDLANPNMSDKKIRTTEEMISVFRTKNGFIRTTIRPVDKFYSSWRNITCIYTCLPTISRRAETHVALSRNEEINKDAAIYLNRLSDLMFILARSINHRKKISDIVWKP